MKKIIPLLLLLPLLAFGQGNPTNVQKTSGTNQLANGSIVVGNSTSITADAGGIVASNAIPLSVGVPTEVPPTLSGQVPVLIDTVDNRFYAYISGAWVNLSSGGGGGGVSSVGLSAPSVFAVSGSPITTSGTLGLTFAGGQTANQVLATPSGSTGAVGLRALAGPDIPPIELGFVFGNGGVTGQLQFDNIQNIPTQGTLLGNTTGINGPPQIVSLTSMIDVLGGSGSAAQGDVLFRNGVAWTRLAAGTSGNVLTTQGAGANPIWAPASGGGGITALTGDVAASGSGSVAATVAKIQGTTVSGTTGTGNVTFSASPALTGVPTAPTASPGTNTTQLATTAFVLANGSGGTPANPTASVGLSAVNGSATTYMRSDAAPVLSQAIAPTWTGLHTFTQSSSLSSGTANGMHISDTLAQTGTAGFTDLTIDRTETSVGSGPQNFLNFSVGGVSKFSVDHTGALTFSGALNFTTLNTTGNINTQGNLNFTNPSTGFTAQFSVAPAFAAYESMTLVTNAPNLNSLALQNTATGNSFSAMSCLGNDNIEHCAFGYGNVVSGGGPFWRAYIEASYYDGGVTTNQPPVPFNIVQTGFWGGAINGYRSQIRSSYSPIGNISNWTLGPLMGNQTETYRYEGVSGNLVLGNIGGADTNGSANLDIVGDAIIGSYTNGPDRTTDASAGFALVLDNSGANQLRLVHATVGKCDLIFTGSSTSDTTRGLTFVDTDNSSVVPLKLFMNGTAAIQVGGKIISYNGATTAGWGVETIQGSGRQTAQTAADASVATTVGAADGSFEVDANVLVTTATLHNFTVTCTYTDEGNTSRTATLNFQNLGGTIATAIANAGGAVPYEGLPIHIRAKAATTITLATTGTFTTVAYNVEGSIRQLN